MNSNSSFPIHILRFRQIDMDSTALAKKFIGNLKSNKKQSLHGKRLNEITSHIQFYVRH